LPAIKTVSVLETGWLAFAGCWRIFTGVPPGKIAGRPGRFFVNNCTVARLKSPAETFY
jgi:hypothetical protein